MAVRDKARTCLQRRENAEYLTLLLLVTVLEVSITLELRYWILGVVTSLVILVREGGLLLMYAGEFEHRVEEAVQQRLARELATVEDEARK